MYTLVSVVFGLLCIGTAILHSRRDAVAVLSAYIVLLWLIPGRLVIWGMGAIGTPAIVAGLVCAGWWITLRVLADDQLATGVQPMRTSVFLYGWWLLLTYAVAFMRPLTGLEARGADRAVIALVSLVGVVLIAADGIESVERLRRLVVRLVLVATVVATIGIVQFATDIDPVSWIVIPGLQANAEIVAERARSIFDRPYSTTLHPIEFSVVCSMVLPLAMHVAMYERRPSATFLYWAPVALIGGAIFVAVSRSGVLTILVAMVVASLAWDWRRRLNVAAGALLFLILLRAAVPGLLGTLRSLILGAQDDPSVQGRLDDVARVKYLLSESLVFGRGPGTFNPAEYFILDNQLYGTAIASGLVGLVTLLLPAALGVYILIRGAGDCDPVVRNLRCSIAGGIAAGAVSMLTFDSLGFPVFSGTFFLFLGLAGSLWRLVPQGVRSTQAVR